MKIVTVCGSMRFAVDMRKIALELETARGMCVLQPVYGDDGMVLTQSEKQLVSKAHLAKIDVSNAIFVVNKGGYIGESTREEIAYAKSRNKEVLYLE